MLKPASAACTMCPVSCLRGVETIIGWDADALICAGRGARLGWRDACIEADVIAVAAAGGTNRRSPVRICHTLSGYLLQLCYLRSGCLR